jgi:hypothetical protein
MQITFTISNLIGIKKYFLHPRIWNIKWVRLLHEHVE